MPTALPYSLNADNRLIDYYIQLTCCDATLRKADVSYWVGQSVQKRWLRYIMGSWGGRGSYELNSCLSGAEGTLSLSRLPQRPVFACKNRPADSPLVSYLRMGVKFYQDLRATKLHLKQRRSFSVGLPRTQADRFAPVSSRRPTLLSRAVRETTEHVSATRPCRGRELQIISKASMPISYGVSQKAERRHQRSRQMTMMWQQPVSPSFFASM